MKYTSSYIQKSKLRGEVHLGIFSLLVLFKVIEMDVNTQKSVPRTDPGNANISPLEEEE